MAYSHRHSDSRLCGATTVVVGQDFVQVDGKLWAVNGDPNTDGAGNLIATKTWVTIGGIPIIVVGNHASPDGLCPIPGGPHCDPIATGFSDLVDVE